VRYVQSATVLSDHWKVESVADHLGISYVQVIGHLHLLWWFTANATDASQTTGDLSRFSAAVLEKRLRWTGTEGALVDALTVAGWLDRDVNGGYHVHDWAEHSGQGVVAMNARAAKMREWRASRSGRAERDVTVTLRDDTVTSRDDTVPSRDVTVTTKSKSKSKSEIEKLSTTATRSARSAPVAQTAVGEPLRHAPSALPAVAIVREVLGVNPCGTVRDAIAAVLETATEIELGKFRDVCATWRLRGFNPRNVAGVLDWYRDGVPPSGAPVRAGGAGAPRRESPAEQMRQITAALEEAERANGLYDPGRRGFTELLAERLPPTRRPRDGSGRVITGLLVGGGTPRLADGGSVDGVR
jgi:hypothetical protein